MFKLFTKTVVVQPTFGLAKAEKVLKEIAPYNEHDQALLMTGHRMGLISAGARDTTQDEAKLAKETTGARVRKLKSEIADAASTRDNSINAVAWLQDLANRLVAWYNRKVDAAKAAYQAVKTANDRKIAQAEAELAHTNEVAAAWAKAGTKKPANAA